MRCPCRCLFDRCRHLPGIHVHVVVYQRDMQKNVPLSLVMINDVVVAHGKRDLPVSPSTPPRSRCARLPPNCCATTDCVLHRLAIKSTTHKRDTYTQNTTSNQTHHSLRVHSFPLHSFARRAEPQYLPYLTDYIAGTAIDSAITHSSARTIEAPLNQYGRS